MIIITVFNNIFLRFMLCTVDNYHYTRTLWIRNSVKGNASYIFPAFLWRDANMEIGGILIGNLLLELPKEEMEANHTTLTLVL